MFISENKSEQMKYNLIDAIKKCMKKTPFYKITVKDIVTQCVTTRQTFYRHFQDKYDLINWYFEKTILSAFEQLGNNKSFYECLVKKYDFIQKEKTFFKSSFRLEETNCLKYHAFEFMVKFYTTLIEEKAKITLSKNQILLLEMYCCSFVYMIKRSLFSKETISSEYIAELLIDAMPEDIKEIISKIN